jgi:hypothetical protein
VLAAAALAVVLCASVAWPGVVEQGDLDAERGMGIVRLAT